MKKPLIILVAAIALACSIAVPTAYADQTFHSQNIPLIPVNGAPLRSGHVVDIHANGPQIYSIERYTLVGAMPNHTYSVQLVVFTAPGCSGSPLLAIPETTLTTNGVGNGEAGLKFTPEQVAPFGVTTFYLVWQVLDQSNQLAYQTACTKVALD